jgi:hypothetical protein
VGVSKQRTKKKKIKEINEIKIYNKREILESKQSRIGLDGCVTPCSPQSKVTLLSGKPLKRRSEFNFEHHTSSLNSSKPITGSYTSLRILYLHITQRPAIDVSFF